MAGRFQAAQVEKKYLRYNNYMSSVVPLQHHSYDLLMRHKNPLALRLNDAHHQQLQVGSLVEYSGHNTVMDRQRFKVVDRMEHPTIHQAVDQIQHSNLSTRDKIQMKNSFLDLHGPGAESHPVVSLHLAPHPMPRSFGGAPSHLG